MADGRPKLKRDHQENSFRGDYKRFTSESTFSSSGGEQFDSSSSADDVLELGNMSLSSSLPPSTSNSSFPPPSQNPRTIPLASATLVSSSNTMMLPPDSADSSSLMTTQSNANPPLSSRAPSLSARGNTSLLTSQNSMDSLLQDILSRTYSGPLNTELDQTGANRPRRILSRTFSPEGITFLTSGHTSLSSTAPDANGNLPNPPDGGDYYSRPPLPSNHQMRMQNTNSPQLPLLQKSNSLSGFFPNDTSSPSKHARPELISQISSDSLGNLSLGTNLLSQQETIKNAKDYRGKLTKIHSLEFLTGGIVQQQQPVYFYPSSSTAPTIDGHLPGDDIPEPPSHYIQQQQQAFYHTNSLINSGVGTSDIGYENHLYPVVTSATTASSTSTTTSSSLGMLSINDWNNQSRMNNNNNNNISRPSSGVGKIHPKEEFNEFMKEIDNFSSVNSNNIGVERNHSSMSIFGSGNNTFPNYDSSFPHSTNMAANAMLNISNSAPPVITPNLIPNSFSTMMSDRSSPSSFSQQHQKFNPGRGGMTSDRSSLHSYSSGHSVPGSPGGSSVNSTVAVPGVGLIPVPPHLRKKARPPNKWKPEEDSALINAVETFGRKNWKLIAQHVPGRSHTQCLQRWNKVLQPGMKHGPFSKEEDNVIIRLVTEQLSRSDRIDWKILREEGLPNRSARQIRERWTSSLSPDVNKSGFTQEEDDLILSMQLQFNNCWAHIARNLKGRTEHSVKTRHKSLMKKMQRDWSIGDYDTRLIQLYDQYAGDWERIKPHFPEFSIAVLHVRYQHLKDGGNSNVNYAL